MILFAESAAHHEPNAMHHVMDTYDWEFFSGWSIPLPEALHLSKFHLLMLMAAGIICAIYIPLGQRIRPGSAPKGAFWNFFEALLTFIRDNVVKPYISHHADHYVPFLWTMFLFVLTCNLLGMFPFLGSPTANISMTGTLAFIVFVYIHMSGLMENGIQGHFFAFVPPMEMSIFIKLPILLMLVPIEFVGLIIKCFVLSVRLFANMFAGHMVLATILIFIWQARHFDPALFWTVTVSSVLGSVALNLLELFVAFLQAFIFTFLTALFLGSILHPEH